ncbi:MAG: hypothetical protein MUE53_03645 [Chitinophagales bacterium]|jgi:hypothetical protein|nr:hypothetical protein [Chitinophagales bacterium]
MVTDKGFLKNYKLVYIEQEPIAEIPSSIEKNKNIALESDIKLADISDLQINESDLIEIEKITIKKQFQHIDLQPKKHDSHNDSATKSLESLPSDSLMEKNEIQVHQTFEPAQEIQANANQEEPIFLYQAESELESELGADSELLEKEKKRIEENLSDFKETNEPLRENQISAQENKNDLISFYENLNFLNQKLIDIQSKELDWMQKNNDLALKIKELEFQLYKLKESQISDRNQVARPIDINLYEQKSWNEPENKIAHIEVEKPFELETLNPDTHLKNLLTNEAEFNQNSIDDSETLIKSYLKPDEIIQTNLQAPEMNTQEEKISEQYSSDEESEDFSTWLEEIEIQKKHAISPISVDQKLDENQLLDSFEKQINQNAIEEPSKAETPSINIKKDPNFEHIISSFVKEQIKRNQDKEPKSKIESDLTTSEFISEALASLYHQQGHKNKAIEMYQKLILHFPEKSVYFAQKIQEIQQNKI